MTTTKDDGGPAFPTAVTDDGHRANGYLGMTLRDYFAGQALAALLREPVVGDWLNPEPPQQFYARVAYEYADALIKERGR